MKLKQWVLLLQLFILKQTLLHAQVSFTDSLFFNTVFQNPSYSSDQIFPGNWFVHPEITSKTMLFNKLDEQFKFGNNDFKGAFRKIKVDSLMDVPLLNQTMNSYFLINPSYGYKQLNPIRSLPFTLNGKSSQAYCSFTPALNAQTGNCKTAFLIITGSGLNNGSELIRGNGYQNYEGYLRDSLKKLGDVFIAFRPLLDFRAFYRRETPGGVAMILNSEFPFPSQITNYLNNRGTPYGTNSLIESIAIMKLLKSKYDRVIIAGLSFGGQYTLLNSFETEPEGCLVSGGYTILVDETIGTNDYQTSHFGDLFYSLNRDTVKSKVNQLSSEFLFSWSTAGDPAEESQLHSTENYFNGSTNTQYYYNYLYHTFPPFIAFRNLMDSINKRAKPSIRELSSSCSPPLANVKVSFCGKKPFHFDLYKDDLFVQHYDLFADTMLLTFIQSGRYRVKNVTDSLGVQGFQSNEYEFIPNAQIDISLAKSDFVCDSNLYRMHFKLTGSPYWDIIYSKNGVMDTIQNLFSDSLLTSWQSGTYIIHSIKDNGACLKIINDTINLNNLPVFNDVFLEKKYHCDSNKMQFTLKQPFASSTHLLGTRNGIPYVALNQNNSLWLPNGNYNFTKIYFPGACSKNIAIPLVVNETPLSALHLFHLYQCDSDKTILALKLLGKSPWDIYYHSDGIPFNKVSFVDTARIFVENGVHLIHSIFDANGCSINPNWIDIIDEEPTQFSILNKQFDCDSNKTKFDLAFQGKSPWVFYYTKNGVNQSKVFTQQNATFYLSNGSYSFNYLRDANSCIYQINENYQLQDSLPAIVISSSNYNCNLLGVDMTFALSGRSPFIFNYFKDGLPYFQTETSTQLNLFAPNGQYFFATLTDSNNCTFHLNTQYTFEYDTLQLSIFDPVFVCDSSKSRFHLTLGGSPPFSVHYTKNGLPQQYITNLLNAELFVTNGLYQFTSVKDNTGCSLPLSQTFLIDQNVLTASLVNSSYDCDSNTMKVEFQLAGNAPWYIHYIQSGVNPTYLTDTTFNPNRVIFLNPGVYTFSTVEDSTLCSDDIYQSITNTFTDLTIQKLSSYYNCDSNSLQINYAFTGEAPWVISHMDNATGIVTYDSTFSTNFSLFLPHGHYTILTIEDAKCMQMLNDTQIVNYTPIITSFVPEAVSCDSGKQYITLVTSSGNKPFTYQYYLNTVFNQIITNQDSLVFYLDNGNYFFSKIVDSLNCEKLYNQSVSAEYYPFSYKGYVSTYSCEKDSTEIDFNILHKNKVWLSYQKQGSAFDTLVINSGGSHSFTFSNGEYNLLGIYDSLGCFDSINKVISIQNKPIALKSMLLEKDCDLRNYSYYLDIEGQSPWQLLYNRNNIIDTLKIPSSPFTWPVDLGNYYFIQLSDSSQCNLFIGQSDTLNRFLMKDPVLTLANNYLITDTTPYHYLWYKDGILIDSLSKYRLATKGSGDYQVGILDDAGCMHYSNSITLDYPQQINLFPNPATSNISIVINGDYGAYWEYMIYDMTGKKVMSGIETNPYKDFQIETLARGTYNLVIVFDLDFSKHILRFSKF